MSQNTEAELERFRQQWRKEVSARTQGKRENGVQGQESGKGHQSQQQWQQPRLRPQQHRHQKQHHAPKSQDDVSDKPLGATYGSGAVGDSEPVAATAKRVKGPKKDLVDGLAVDDLGDDDVLEPRTFDENAGHGKNRRRLSGRSHDRTVEVKEIFGDVEDAHSALEHYERAVEKESLGSLGESVDLYRKAFKVTSL